MDNDEVHLLWFRPETQTWAPRLKWKHADALLGSSRGPLLESFAPGLAATLDESSVFGQKLICCRITRDTKRTLAGHRFKVTGPPRFGTSKVLLPVVPPPIVEQPLESDEAARHVLVREFGIPLEQSVGLHLTRSIAADPLLWSHM
jgi:hypothetical protein